MVNDTAVAAVADVFESSSSGRRGALIHVMNGYTYVCEQIARDRRHCCLA
jgi:hypothetical protein